MALPVDWTGADAAHLAAGTIRAGVVVIVGRVHDAIRVWSGVGDLSIPFDTVDEWAGIYAYKGLGALTGLPVVSQLINGLAERVDFTLSAVGMPAEIALAAQGEAAVYRDARVNLGVVVFDAQWQQVASTLWLWEGTVDSIKVERSSDGDGGVVRTIGLSAASAFSGRRRPMASYWTDPDQRRRNPDDRFFDRVDLYSQGSTMVWPK
jgi:hypothetical protein